MKAKFEVAFLKQAEDFIAELDEKTRNKVFFNIDKARFLNDPKLFKKLDDEIWEFRIRYSGTQLRFLSFWVKEKGSTTLVVCTHGFVKKESKVPKSELEKAHRLMNEYKND